MLKKTIVMIGNTSWGMFHFRAETMKEFVSRGHKVIVLAPRDEFSHHFSELKCDFVSIELDRKGANPLRELATIQHLTQHLLSLKPDVVLSYTIKPAIYGTIAAKIAGVPKIIAITTGLGFVFSHNNLISKIAKILYKMVLKFAHEVWFLNREDEAVFLKTKLISLKKSFVLPGEGVNTDIYKPTKIKNESITFTLVSRMLWDKGVGIFVDSARNLKWKYPDITFQILGPVDEGNPEGISLTQLKKWHDEGFVCYLGFTKDIRPVLNQTTCLVHPTFYREGLPRILIEACAMEIPCITTDTPGCRDVIEDGNNGFLVKPNDLESLIEGIEKFLMLSDVDRIKLSKHSRENVCNKFSTLIINDFYIQRIGL